MEKDNIPAIRRVAGLPRKREETVEILSECYARDLIELDEYERRIDLIHDAATLDDLEALLSDVPADVSPVTAVECWGSDFYRSYYSDSIDYAPTEGSADACAFAGPPES